MMQIMLWNVRGVVSSNSRLMMLRKQHNHSILVLMKPFVSVDKIDRWAKRLRFPNYVSNVGEGGKIWMFWEIELSFSLISISGQEIS